MDILSVVCAYAGFALSVAIWVFTLFRQRFNLRVSFLEVWPETENQEIIKLRYRVLFENRSFSDVSVIGMTLLLDGLEFDFLSDSVNITYTERSLGFPLFLPAQTGREGCAVVPLPKDIRIELSTPQTFLIRTTRRTVRLTVSDSIKVGY